MLEKIAYNRTTILKNTFSILLLLLILVVEGCFNFLTFEFKAERLISLGFWTTVGTKVVLLILVKMWVMSIFIDVARNKNLDLDFVRKVNERLLETKDNNFAKWVENVENAEIKIEFYKKKISKKIARLEHKATSYDRMLYFSDREEEKSTNKYCIKRSELDYLMSDEYVKKNIAWLDVKNYPQIDSAVFDCPINNDNIFKKYQLSAKTKTAIFATLLSACFITLIFQTVWNLIEMSNSDVNALVIVASLIMDLIFIGWQGLTGISSAFSIIDQQEILPYVNRNRILEKYLYYKNEDKVKETREWINQMKRECKDVKEQK
jgi:hypothetical protein